MSTLLTLDVQVIPIDNEFGHGYALIHKTDLQSSTCIIAVNDSGELFCASEKSFGEITIDNITDLLRFNQTDSREHAPWAFAMLGSDRIDTLIEKLDLPHENRDGLRVELSEVVKLENLKINNVDRDGLRAIEKSTKQSKSCYSFYAGIGERSIIRRQAAASYPVLADILSSNLSAKMAIDRKKPIADLLVGLLSKTVNATITKPILKRLSVVDTIPEGVQLSSVIRLMASVPLDWIPRDGREWKAFCNVATGLFDDLSVSIVSVPTMVKSAQGKWSDFCHRVIKKAGHDYPDNVDDETLGDVFRSTMRATAEMISDFSNIVVLPLAAHGGDSNEVMITPEMMMAARDSSFRMLFADRTLMDVADQQRRFFLGRAGMLSAVGAAESEARAELLSAVEIGTWPGLTPSVQCPNGLWLVPLRSKEELVEEGNRLSHCVGGYDGVAKRCESFIVSVRTLNDQGGVEHYHSTIEFNALDHSSDVVQVKQHMGHRNGPPDVKAKDAALWYASAISAGNIKLNRKLINAYLDETPTPDDGVERLCNYDWKERSSLNLAIMPWFPFVNKKYQSMTMNDLMDSTEISSISDMIAPDPLSFGMG